MSFNPDKINIHELTIEEPEKAEVSFDINEVVTESDVNEIEECIENPHNKFHFLYANASLAILDKERLPKLKPETIVDIRGTINESIISPQHKLESMAWASYISPEFKKVERTGFEHAVEYNNEKLDEMRKKGDWQHFFRTASWLTLVDRRPGLSGEDFEKLKTELESHYDDESWGVLVVDVVQEAAAMAILFPNHPLNISKDLGRRLVSALEMEKKEAKSLKSKSWFMHLAMAKIVSDKVKKESSFKIGGSPTMPETKQF